MPPRDGFRSSGAEACTRPPTSAVHPHSRRRRRTRRTRLTRSFHSPPSHLTIPDVKLLGEIFNNYRARAGSRGSDGAADVADDALAVVSVCGQGSPQEARLDPDNNRCRPCPHVESAVQAFKRSHPTRRAEYIFVPCDGSGAHAIAPPYSHAPRWMPPGRFPRWFT